MRIKEEDPKDIMREALESFKEVTTNVVPMVSEANMMAVLHALKDPKCMALRPQMEEIEHNVGGDDV